MDPAVLRVREAPSRCCTAQGHIKAQLHGPEGDLNGALLEDGTIVRLPPPEARRLAADLTPGAPLCVEGDGFTGPLGRVIEASSIGPNQNQLAQIAAPPPPLEPALPSAAASAGLASFLRPLRRPAEPPG